MTLNKYTTSILLLLPLLAEAETLQYQSAANEVILESTGDVLIKALRVEKDDEIACSNENFDFRFNLQSIVKQKWYDTILLSRNSGTLLDFIYDSENCALQAIRLPKIYNSGTDVGNETPIGELKETGEYGNVLLIGTNGLTSASFNASSFYGQDTETAAFDGFVYDEKHNIDAGDKISRGIWLVKNVDSEGEIVEPWIQVDFGKEVSLVGMRLSINKQSLELGRSPRNVILMTSNNGEEFEEVESFHLPQENQVTGNFSDVVKARYFRLKVASNHGDAKFIEIDEWELYQ